MKQFTKLGRIIFIALICININLFQGCTSGQNIAVSGTENSLFEIDTNYEEKGEGQQKSIQAKDVRNKNINLKAENQNRILNYDEVKNELIRFHVIANSDSEEDQNLKLKVKNKVIDYLYPYLNESQSLDESRKIIKDKMEEVKKLAEEVIKDNNYKYGVKTELSKENFPEKSYGKITLPQGNYEAFRIIIGAGQGKNWWCVMFPPLCFVDESKAEVEYDKTEERINSKKESLDLQMNLNVDEDKSEDADKKNTEDENKEDVQVKFKLVEIIKSLFN